MEFDTYSSPEYSTSINVTEDYPQISHSTTPSIDFMLGTDSLMLAWSAKSTTNKSKIYCLTKQAWYGGWGNLKEFTYGNYEGITPTIGTIEMEGVTLLWKVKDTDIMARLDYHYGQGWNTTDQIVTYYAPTGKNPVISPAGYDRLMGWSSFDSAPYVIEVGTDEDFDTYQEYLLTLAQENKSLDNNATFSNNSRHLAESGNYLHEVFASGGEIFYRQSTNGGNSWYVTERISSGNGENKNACLTFWSDEESGTLHVVWERKIGDYEYEVWYSKSDAIEMDWTDPVILPDAVVDINGNYQNGAMPVISYVQDVAQLVVVFCSNEGLHYRLSWDYGDNWLIPAEDIIVSSYRVRYPTLSRYYDYLSLVYEIRSNPGVYSRIFNGSTWSSETHVADITGTWYNRMPSVTVDIEGNPLSVWRGQIYDGSLDPDYSIVFRNGYNDNSWSDWFVIFEHASEVTSVSPSVSAMSREQVPAGIALIHSATNDEVTLRKYSYESQQWNEQTVSTSGKWPNIAEYFPETTDHIRYMWTDQSESPYLVEVDWDYSEGISPMKPLVSNSNPPNLPKISNVTHKRRAVIRDKQSGSSLIIDIDPLIIQNTNLEEKTVPFIAHDFLDSINITFQNMSSYLRSETDSLKNEAKFLKHQFNMSYSSGVDSSGIEYPNVFDGKYQIFLNVKDIRNPKSNVRINVTNIPSFVFDVASFRRRRIEVKTELQLSNLDTTRLEIGIGDVYSPASKVSKENSIVLGAEKSNLAIPEKYALRQNYPNPFNPTTTIAFDLPQNSFVELEVYDVSGRRLRTVISKTMEAGSHQVIWDGRDEFGNHAASGVYFYRIQAVSSSAPKEAFTAVNKMMLLK